MKRMDFCDVLGDVSEEYLEETDCFRQESSGKMAEIKQIPRRRFSFAAAVACLCLLFSSVAVLAMSGAGTKLLDSFTDKWRGFGYKESGYDLSVLVEKIPTESLQGEVQEAKTMILKQYQEYQPHNSWLPGHWMKQFNSREAALQYVGFDRLKELDFGVAEEETTVNVHGNAVGDIQWLHMETSYRKGDIRIQFFSTVYTENYKGEITTGTRTTESVVYEETFYNTKNGKQCHVIESSPMESGYICLDGYLVDQGVLYQLHMAYYRKDAEQAEEILYRWAELF